MAKGKAIYFSKSELENMNEFINHWDDKLSADDEEFYRFWLEKVGAAFSKIAEACKTERQGVN